MHFKSEVHVAPKEFVALNTSTLTRVPLCGREVLLGRVYLLAVAAEFSSGIAALVIPRGFFVIEKLFNSLANPLNRTLESVSQPQTSLSFSLSLSILPSILFRKTLREFTQSFAARARKHAFNVIYFDSGIEKTFAYHSLECACILFKI